MVNLGIKLEYLELNKLRLAIRDCEDHNRFHYLAEEICLRVKLISVLENKLKIKS
jgi:hypothetical protein